MACPIELGVTPDTWPEPEVQLQSLLSPSLIGVFALSAVFGADVHSRAEVTEEAIAINMPELIASNGRTQVFTLEEDTQDEIRARVRQIAIPQ